MLRGFEGFDNFPSGADGSWNRTSGFIQFDPTGSFCGISRPGRNNYGGALFEQSLLSTFGTFAPVFADRMAELTIGIAALTITGFSPPSDDSLIMCFTSTVSGQGNFVVQFRKTTGSIKIYGGDLGLGEFVPIGPVIFETANNVWTPDVWNYFEVRGVIHPTHGSIEVRVNEVPLVTLKGIKTQYGADPFVDQVLFGHPWFGTSDFLFDDFYVCDGNPGSGASTEFLGDMRVITLNPVSNDVVQFTPLAKTNWEEVAEPQFDADVSYNYANTVGFADSFRFAPFLNTVSFVAGLKLEGAYRKDDAGFRQMQQFIRFPNLESVGATHTLSDSTYVFFTDLWIVSPRTGVNFTDLDLNELAAGYRLTA